MPDIELAMNWYASLSRIAVQELYISNDPIDESRFTHACVAVRTAAR